MTPTKEYPPAIGALLRLAWQGVRERIYEGVLQAGYTDLSRAHVLLFRWPTIDGLRPSELAARNQLSRQAVNDLLSDLEKRGFLSAPLILQTDVPGSYASRSADGISRR
jgi:hypothetical protein